MEDKRVINFISKCATLGISLSIPLFSFAYDQDTTHAALTQEIIQFYNRNFQKQIPGEEGELIIQGSIDEDDGVRFLRHFYDPIKNRGLALGEHSDELAMLISAVQKKDFAWPSSKEWAKTTELQSDILKGPAGIFSSFFSGKDDYSWERSLYEYAWGDKRRGLSGLGHILHLLEDMTVPDHTRNDPHPPFHEYAPAYTPEELKILLSFQASPYETYGERYDRKHINIESEFIKENRKPILKNNIDEYFDVLASYSNNNFFSKDTILTNYSLPKILEERIEMLSDGKKYSFGYSIDNLGNGVRVVKIDRATRWSESAYSLSDNDDLVLSSYWSNLSKQAILHGAGVVKLFFDEVEKEKQTKTLYSKNRSWVGKMMDKTKVAIFNAASVLYGITAPYNLEPAETAGMLEALPTSNPIPDPSLPPAELSVQESLAGEPPAETALPTILPTEVSPKEPTLVELPPTESTTTEEIPTSALALEAATTTEALATTTPNVPTMPEPEVFVSAPLYRRGPEHTAAYTPAAMDVIINEIAWAGTAASTTADEWIELYNRTSQSIVLDGWVLRSATDEKPYLNLTGAIPAGGYYLIERTDDNTVKNVTADLTAAFGSGTGMGLVDTGEVLMLQYASTTIDQTPALNSCGANKWCGGNTSERKTMERIDPDLSGADTASWGANNGLIKNGSSTDAIALNGTPKSRNSRNYYISQSGTVSSSQTLTSSRSPYFIESGGLTISSGATLTINPGVVVKFYGNGSDLTVNGTLKALGSSVSEVVFTSFYDDNYGGDMNADGSATSASAGDWRHIAFNSASQNSEFSYTRVRYGGKWYAGQTAGHALIKADNASLTVSNSVFERSIQAGLWLINSTSTISNSTIQNNAMDFLSYGILMEGGASTVQSNTLTSNTIGIRVENGGSPSISGNTFTGNTNEAISVVGSMPALSSNSASSNGTNGVFITGMLPANYTFSSNLPYVVDATLTLISGKTFGTTAGTVFKGRTSSATIEVQGIFNISGTSGSPVVFTSLKDDNYGGDANADGSATSASAGDWRAVNFASTATSSSVSYALVRYGGDSTLGAMSIDSVGVDVSNSTFEYNKYKGLRLSSATSTLSNLTVRNHTSGGGEPVGLSIESGSRAVVSNSSFSDNTYGVMSTDGSTVSNGGGNTFSGNTNNTFPAGLLE